MSLTESSTAEVTGSRVAEAIRAEMKRRKVSQRALGEQIDMPQRRLSRRLTGEVDFRYSEIQQIARALGVPLSRFMPTEPEQVAA